MIKKGKSKEAKRLTQAGESIKGLKGIPAQACPGNTGSIPPSTLWLVAPQRGGHFLRNFPTFSGDSFRKYPWKL